MRTLLFAALALVRCGAHPPETAHAARPGHDYRELEQPNEPTPLPPETSISAADVDADLDLLSYARLNETKTKRDASVAHGAPEWKVTENAKRSIDLGSHAFHGPIAILVDAACASSCEGARLR